MQRLLLYTTVEEESKEIQWCPSLTHESTMGTQLLTHDKSKTGSPALNLPVQWCPLLTHKSTMATQLLTHDESTAGSPALNPPDTSRSTP